MYYIDSMQKNMPRIIAGLEDALARVESEEFRQEVLADRKRAGFTDLRDWDIYANKSGALNAAINSALISLRIYAAEPIPEALEESALMERRSAILYNLDVSDDDLPYLEALSSDFEFNSEHRTLREAICGAAGEVRGALRDREYDNTIEMLEAAGFVFQQTDDFEGWERTIPGTGAACDHSGRVDRVTIDIKRKHSDFWYEFLLEQNGDGILCGRSGEFGKLLAAVGISQEVPAK